MRDIYDYESRSVKKEDKTLGGYIAVWAGHVLIITLPVLAAALTGIGLVIAWQSIAWTLALVLTLVAVSVAAGTVWFICEVFT